MSIKLSGQFFGRRAFSLVEVLVAMGASGLVVLAVTSILMFSGKTFAALFNYVDLDDANRVTMDTLTRDVRQAQRVISFTTNASVCEFVLEDDAHNPLTYRYSPAARTLTRISSSSSKVLLTQCDTFRFEIGQRTPRGGSYEVFPAADATTAKVLNLTWVCSRTILGYRANTESVQTARIVIRRQGT